MIAPEFLFTIRNDCKGKTCSRCHKPIRGWAVGARSASTGVCVPCVAWHEPELARTIARSLLGHGDTSIPEAVRDGDVPDGDFAERYRIAAEFLACVATREAVEEPSEDPAVAAVQQKNAELKRQIARFANFDACDEPDLIERTDAATAGSLSEAVVSAIRIDDLIGELSALLAAIPPPQIPRLAEFRAVLAEDHRRVRRVLALMRSRGWADRAITRKHITTLDIAISAFAGVRSAEDGDDMAEDATIVLEAARRAIVGGQRKVLQALATVAYKSLPDATRPRQPEAAAQLKATVRALLAKTRLPNGSWRVPLSQELARGWPELVAGGGLAALGERLASWLGDANAQMRYEDLESDARAHELASSSGVAQERARSTRRAGEVRAQLEETIARDALEAAGMSSDHARGAFRSKRSGGIKPRHT